MLTRSYFCRTVCLLLAVSGLAIASQAVAQPPSSTLEPSKVNVARLRWLRYRLVAGRIVATSSYPEGMNISFGPSVVDGRQREHLQLLILKNQATVRYELEGEGDQLTIGLSESGVFEISRTRREPPLAFQFVQPPGRPISLSVTENDEQRVFRGASVWHLYLAEPEWTTAELIPYLEMLRPTWNLAAAGAALEEMLLQRARGSHTVDTARWTQLVAQLASANFAERESAQRELTRIGPVLSPFLESLRSAELDAEQAARVAKLTEVLAVDYEDTVDRVATWLAADPQVWLSLLSREELAKREAAATQLAALSGQTIEFNPAADEPTRRAQIVALRLRFGEQAATQGADAIPPADLVPPPGVER